MNSSPLLSDIAAMKPLLSALKTDWDGKECVLELKEANYQWKQMEWIGWYFELLCRRVLNGLFAFPGDRFGRVGFDMKRSVNWDLKAKAVKSDSHDMPLNDQRAIHMSVERDGLLGVVVALCDVEYNDMDRTFQAWHTALKGGLSKYEKKRRAAPTVSVSRYRKTHASLLEILFLEITPVNLPLLDSFLQGKNSNDRPRAPKYRLDLERAAPLIVDHIVFDQG